MMVALLLYGYSRGLYSSRQLARACEERVDVMAVTGLISAPSPTSASAT
jgi:transposase